MNDPIALAMQETGIRILSERFHQVEICSNYPGVDLDYQERDRRLKIKWSRNKHQNIVSELGYVLALVGAVVMILLSLGSFFGLSVALPFQVPMAAMFGSAIIGIILGVVAFIGSKHVRQLIWAVALLVIGFVGGGLGGLMVILGGLLGIISRFL